MNKIIKLFAIIPARSGSKGIKDKNIRLLVGKSLIQRAVEVFCKANIAQSELILSTDSEKYANLAKSYDLKVPFIRPKALSGDKTSALDVIEHSMQWFYQSHQYYPELILWLQPTSPFRTSLHIQQAIELMNQHQADSVIACAQIERDETTLFHHNNPFLSALSTNTQQYRRQDVSPLLTPNGLLYLVKSDYWLKNRSLYAKRTVPLLCNKLESIDIDTEIDWQIAESILSHV